MKLSDILLKPTKPRILDLKGTTVHLDRAVTKLQRKYGARTKKQSSNDLNQKLEDFESRIQRNDWSQFPWHMASEVLRSFFTAECREDPRWKNTATVLIDTLEKTNRKSFCRAAIDAYIETYNEAGLQLGRFRDVIREKDTKDLPIRKNLITDYDFFNPQSAHIKIGKILANNDTPYELVKSWDIWSPHSLGLFQSAFQEMLRENDDDLEKMYRPSFERIMNWLRPNSNTKAELSRAVGIDALILPFKKGESAALRDDVEKFLIRNYGDPRITPAEWSGVSDDALEIINRWMTSKSLKMFFDIINKFEDSHMWEPRRKFWTAIDERKWIDEAWVVLNDKGAQFAKSLAQEHDDLAFMSHGLLNFTEREKCFFIMKVGKLTIVEGTHNFKVRIFKDEAKNSLILRKKNYSKNEISRAPNLGQGEAFTHDASGRWMTKTETFMRNNR